MGLPNLPLGASNTGTNDWADVYNNDSHLSDILNGNVEAANLASNAVTTAKIADANVTDAKLADDAVSEAKLADNAVSKAKLADDSVGSAELDLNTTGDGDTVSSLSTSAPGTLVSTVTPAAGVYLISAYCLTVSDGTSGEVFFTLAVDGTTKAVERLAVSGTAPQAYYGTMVRQLALNGSEALTVKAYRSGGAAGTTVTVSLDVFGVKT